MTRTLEAAPGRVWRRPTDVQSPLRRREERIGWLLVSPWVIGLTVFYLGPMLYSLYLSFCEANMISPPSFVGLQNYVSLFSANQLRSLFWKSFFNTSYYVFFSVPLSVALGFGMAVLLNEKMTGRGFFRTAFYLPSILPHVAAAMLWLWVFHREFGILNAVLRVIGIEGPPWLTSTTWAKPALVLMSLWGAGGNILVFLAGLQGVPTDLYDAARVDGAGAISRFLHITLPMVTPTLLFVLVTSIIGSFQVFVSTVVMTGGGPANSTLMYVLYLYNLAFRQFKMGFASALAWVYFVLLMVGALLLFRSSRAWVYYEGDLLGGKGR